MPKIAAYAASYCQRLGVPAPRSGAMNRRTFLVGSALAAAATVVRARSAARAALADLDFASAGEVARAIRRGDMSSVELTPHAVERIKRYNPRLNAIVTLTEDAALARARAADEARARGDWWGPLHGVPCTIKDTFETAGVKTTAGVSSLAQHVPARDAAVVERYRSEEHTSELQSQSHISYAVFCLK